MKDKETEKALEAYREAAKADAWLFGDYDAYESYGINKKKVSDTDDNSWASKNNKREKVFHK